MMSQSRSASARWCWGAVALLALAVAVAKGVAVWERATALPVSASAAPVASAPSPPPVRVAGVPIERVALGDRVPGENPAEAADERFGPAVDPPTWRRVDLRCRKRDGSDADVSLLRPAWWVEREGARVGATVRIAVPECGIDGDAQVLAVGQCPAVRAGPGSVVTGTFRHRGASVVDVRVEGLDGPIGTTPNHKFWSDTRQAFVRADSLTPGELLRAGGGTRKVLAVTPTGGSADVFNLETYPQHVYHVSRAGVLVHNTDADTLARIKQAAGTQVARLQELAMPATGRVPVGNNYAGFLYILIDDMSGQILKVGITGGVNIESRFTQYQTWARREATAWGENPGWQSARPIRMFYLTFAPGDGGYGAAAAAETSIRTALDTAGERLPWDFAKERGDKAPVKPKDFGGSSKDAPELKNLPPRC